MYYNRSGNSGKPHWITLRGSSKLEGYPPHLHACLPGTNYGAVLAEAIVTLFNFEWNQKRSVQNGGATNHQFYDLWLLERQQQVCQSMGWNNYMLPDWTPAPLSTDEKFGMDFEADADHTALAMAEARHHWGTHADPTLEEDDELLASNTAAVLCFLGKQCTDNLHIYLGLEKCMNQLSVSSNTYNLTFVTSRSDKTAFTMLTAFKTQNSWLHLLAYCGTDQLKKVCADLA